MLDHEGTVTVYSGGRPIGRLIKERQAVFWYPDEDLTRLVDTPPHSAMTYAGRTVEETLEKIEQALKRLGIPD